MPVDEKVRKALDLRKLKLPATPHVVQIEVENDVDAAGDDALRVSVVLSEDTDEFKFRGKDIVQLKRAIRDSLQAHGIRLFPIIYLTKESERQSPESAE